MLQDELLAIWERHTKTVLFVTHAVDEAVYLADRVLLMTAARGGSRPISRSRCRDRAGVTTCCATRVIRTSSSKLVISWTGQRLSDICALSATVSDLRSRRSLSQRACSSCGKSRHSLSAALTCHR